MVSVEIFFLVIGAALFHAIWNFFARKVKGNIGVVWIAFFVGDLLSIPPALYFFIKDGYESFSSISNGVYAVIGSGIIHALYLITLSLAYKSGEISLVYPIARGTGVGLTSIVSAFILKEDISTLGYIGITSIIMGIFTLGLQIRKEVVIKYFNMMKNQIQGKKPIPVEHKEEMVQLTTEEDQVDISEDLTQTVPLEDSPTEDAPKVVEAYQQEHGNLRKALILSVVTGISISGYSVVDSIGVKSLNPIFYMACFEMLSSIFAAPYILYRHKEEAVKSYKKYIAFIGPSSFVSYIAILYAFQQANTSYVVAMREVSVVIGAILGFVFLKEEFTIRKGVGILFIAAGLVLVKLS